MCVVQHKLANICNNDKSRPMANSNRCTQIKLQMNNNTFILLLRYVTQKAVSQLMCAYHVENGLGLKSISY